VARIKPLDFAKAAGAGLLILVLDLAAAFAAVTFYSLVVDPGHPQSYYVAAAPAISTVSTRIAGPLLFVLVVWLFSRRRPDRNAWAFALATFAFYFVLDWATIAFQPAFLTLPVLATMALKLAGALVGAALALRSR
jgi:hypothetical protein